MLEILRTAAVIAVLVVPIPADLSIAAEKVERMSPEQLRQCYALKGRPAMISFSTEGCVRPYADAGKVCTDGAQCEGECIYDGTKKRSRPLKTLGLKGTCEAETGHIGCRSILDAGVLIREPCI